MGQIQPLSDFISKCFPGMSPYPKVYWLLSHYNSRGEQLQKSPAHLESLRSLLTDSYINYSSALGNKRNKVFYLLRRRRMSKSKELKMHPETGFLIGH